MATKITQSKNTPLSVAEIGAKIRAGKTFEVGSERERKAALQAAKYLGVMVSSRFLSRNPGSRYTIFFLNGGEK